MIVTVPSQEGGMVSLASWFRESALVLLFGSVLASAQSMDHPSDPSYSATLKQQGKLFTIQVVRGEPIRFFVVGREEAKLDLASMALTARRLEPYPGQVMSLDRRNDYFVPTDPKALENATVLEVTAKTKTKSETMRIQLKNEKP